MSDTSGYTVRTLAELCGGRLADPAGLAGVVVSSVATVEQAGPSAITWITEPKHAKGLADCKASAVIGTEDLLVNEPRGVIVTDPELAIAKVLDHFAIPPHRPAPGIHPTALVHESAQLGANVAIGAYAVVHPKVRIGADTVIHEGVSLGLGVSVGSQTEIHDRCVVYDRCEIGNRVIIHAGAVIGADGFGYIFRDGGHRKFSHIGTIIIEDDVDIGANTCIDRAKIGSTCIGRGTKIDNLVQIAHNVRIGQACVITAQCGLAGSVRMGTGVVLGGQSGVVDGMEIGDGVQVGAQSGVTSHLASRSVVFGMPARDRTAVFRDQARVHKLPKVFEEIAALKRRVAELEAAADNRE